MSRELKREIDELKNKSKQQQADFDRKLAQVRASNDDRGGHRQEERRQRSRSRQGERKGDKGKGGKGGKNRGDRRR